MRELSQSSRNVEGLCADLQTVGAWLALNDPVEPAGARALVLFGNQVIATLTAACQRACARPDALLVFSGGVGHSTGLLYENLRASDYGELVRRGQITAEMGEAAMYAVVAERVFGIEPGRIRVESASRNGGENARFTLRLLKDANIGDGSVLLWQDPTMQRRSAMTWRREAEQAGTSLHAVSCAAFVPRVEAGPNGMPRLVAAQRHGTWSFERFVGLLLGEVERLRDDENGYGPRGRNFFDHVEIPPAVMASYERLCASELAAVAQR